MICRECETWMSEYLAGTLPAARAAELERHLAVCQACRTAAERFRKSVADLRDAFAGEQPPELTAAVLARAQASLGARGAQPWWVPALAGAALLLMLALPLALRRQPALNDREVLQTYAEDVNQVVITGLDTSDWSEDEGTEPYGYIPDSQLKL